MSNPDTEIVGVDKRFGQNPDTSPTAYYRLPEEVKDFLLKCQQKHGVVGFRWDPEDPWNFGVLLSE